jgi:hypothetical protein
MPDDALTLVASRVTYYSQEDETAFFEWLDRLECVEGYRGSAHDLFIRLKRPPTKADLQELLALFFRYGVDMRQLARFETKSNQRWLRDPAKYWHGLVFHLVE